MAKVKYTLPARLATSANPDAEPVTGLERWPFATDPAACVLYERLGIDPQAVKDPEREIEFTPPVGGHAWFAYDELRLVPTPAGELLPYVKSSGSRVHTKRRRVKVPVELVEEYRATTPYRRSEDTNTDTPDNPADHPRV